MNGMVEGSREMPLDERDNVAKDKPVIGMPTATLAIIDKFVMAIWVASVGLPSKAKPVEPVITVTKKSAELYIKTLLWP